MSDKTEVFLPDVVRNYILQHGRTIRGKSPKELYDKCKFYVMPKKLKSFYKMVNQGQIWGGCYKKNEVWIDDKHLPELIHHPSSHVHKIWHELVHNAQRLDMGSAMFDFKYVLGLIRHFGKWKKISLEKEAFEEEARFKNSMKGRDWESCD